MISNSVIHLQSYTNSAIADISAQISPETLILPRHVSALIADIAVPSADVSTSTADIVALSGECSSVLWCFTSCSWCFTTFHDVSQCFTSVSWCFTMFNNVLWCLVRCTTIGIGDCAADDRLRDHDNAVRIGDNSAEIGDDAAGIVDIPTKEIPRETPSWTESGITLFLEDN